MISEEKTFAGVAVTARVEQLSVGRTVCEVKNQLHVKAVSGIVKYCDPSIINHENKDININILLHIITHINWKERY